MAITNLIAVGTSFPSSWVEVTVAIGDPKTLIVIGPAPKAEYEIAVLASDGNRYSLATMDQQDIKDGGILSVPGTYQIRRLKVYSADSGEGSGLDIMDGS